MQRNEILHMQVRLFRLACKEWNINANRCAELFETFKINEYIKMNIPRWAYHQSAIGYR